MISGGGVSCLAAHLKSESTLSWHKCRAASSQQQQIAPSAARISRTLFRASQAFLSAAPLPRDCGCARTRRQIARQASHAACVTELSFNHCMLWPWPSFKQARREPSPLHTRGAFARQVAFPRRRRSSRETAARAARPSRRRPCPLSDWTLTRSSTPCPCP